MRQTFPRSVLEFQQRFSSEEDCVQYLIACRWPERFVCPRCQNKEAYWKSARQLFQCKDKVCGYQSSVTAGTIMHRSRMPLTMWFWAAFLVTTHTPGMSALQFQRQIGLSNYETAFLMLHKLRAAMVRDDNEMLKGTIEVDECYIGGPKKGKAARGALGKVIVAGAVEVIGERAGRVRLQVVPSVSGSVLGRFVLGNVQQGSMIVTDGYNSYSLMSKLGYEHKATIIGNPERASKLFPHIHRIFSNLKTWLLGTHHGVNPQHMQAYLNEFTFRFNRRNTPMVAFKTVLGLTDERLGPTSGSLYNVAKKKCKTAKWQHPTHSVLGS